jgi:thiosulfate/3-mercaptopyruvate sulfurtransferase
VKSKFSSKSSRGYAKELKVTVTPSWLKERLTLKNLAILDARSRSAYRKSHIRRAIHADLFHYFVPGTDHKGLQEFHADLARRLGKLGLTGKETIIVYESGFGMRAARVAWMLEYAGSPKVLLLEGGFRAWRKLRYPTERLLVTPGPQTFRFSPVPRLLATATQVKSGRPQIILDVRSQAEFNGTDGRECDTRKGRIPRSRWIEWTNFNDGEKFRPLSQMKRALKQSGLSKGDTVVTYCHRGARAASAFYALRSLGYANVKNYIGSWHEWSARKNLPIVK